MSDCLFCRIVAGEIPSRELFHDDHAVSFLDIAPYHRGHSLIVPRRHIADGTTDPSVWEEVCGAIVAVSELLKAKLGATGVNILSNAGAVSGQEIFHFHVHILPRYPNNPGMAGLLQRDPEAAADLDGLHRLLTG